MAISPRTYDDKYGDFVFQHNLSAEDWHEASQIAGAMDAKKQTVWNRIKRAEETCGDLLAVKDKR